MLKRCINLNYDEYQRYQDLRDELDKKIKALESKNLDGLSIYSLYIDKCKQERQYLINQMQCQRNTEKSLFDELCASESELPSDSTPVINHRSL